MTVNRRHRIAQIMKLIVNGFYDDDFKPPILLYVIVRDPSIYRAGLGAKLKKLFQISSCRPIILRPQKTVLYIGAKVGQTIFTEGLCIAATVRERNRHEK